MDHGFVAPAIHPDNKIEYADQDRVEVVLDGRPPIYTGTIIGKATQGLIDHWIVLLDAPLPGWPYRALSLQHSFIRRLNSNRPFLCEVAGNIG